MKKSDREIKLYQDFILEFGKELKSKITDSYSFRDDLLRNKFKTDESTQERALAACDSKISAYRSAVYLLIDTGRKYNISDAELGFTGLKKENEGSFENFFRE